MQAASAFYWATEREIFTADLDRRFLQGIFRTIIAVADMNGDGNLDLVIRESSVSLPHDSSWRRHTVNLRRLPDRLLMSTRIRIPTVWRWRISTATANRMSQRTVGPLTRSSCCQATARADFACRAISFRLVIGRMNGCAPQTSITTDIPTSLRQISMTERFQFCLAMEKADSPKRMDRPSLPEPSRGRCSWATSIRMEMRTSS